MERYICFINFNYEWRGNIKFGIYDYQTRDFLRIIYDFKKSFSPSLNYMRCISFNEAEKTMRFQEEEVVIHDVRTLFVMPDINQDDIRHLDKVIFKLMEEMNLRENNKEMYDYLSNYRCVRLARFFSSFKVKTL